MVERCPTADDLARRRMLLRRAAWTLVALVAIGALAWKAVTAPGGVPDPTAPGAHLGHGAVVAGSPEDPDAVHRMEAEVARPHRRLVNDDDVLLQRIEAEMADTKHVRVLDRQGTGSQRRRSFAASGRAC